MIEDGGLRPHSYIMIEDDGLAEAPLVHNMIEDGGLRPHSYIMIEDGGLRPHTYTMIENDGMRPHISPTQYEEEWWSEAFTYVIM